MDDQGRRQDFAGGRCVPLRVLGHSAGYGACHQGLPEHFRGKQAADFCGCAGVHEQLAARAGPNSSPLCPPQHGFHHFGVLYGICGGRRHPARVYLHACWRHCRDHLQVCRREPADVPGSLDGCGVGQGSGHIDSARFRCEEAGVLRVVCHCDVQADQEYLLRLCRRCVRLCIRGLLDRGVCRISDGAHRSVPRWCAGFGPVRAAGAAAEYYQCGDWCGYHDGSGPENGEPSVQVAQGDQAECDHLLPEVCQTCVQAGGVLEPS
mmetsp:Transcript_29436/g.70579  ORF Transcript_29436/g.70579 Transcript_29436/m.70579 type:complete len:264 (-) Transcript_29436:1093-1884(-)